MTPFDASPSGRSDRTLFEQELVNAMKDLANSAATPAFDADVIVRSTRRKRAMTVAAVTAAIVIGGAGTALATIGHGTAASGPATAASATVTANPSATTTASPSATTTARSGWYFATVYLAVHGTGTGKTFKIIDLGGLDLTDAKTLLQENGLVAGKITWMPCTGPRSSVLMVFHGSSRDVSKGDSVNLDLCSGSL